MTIRLWIVSLGLLGSLSCGADFQESTRVYVVQTNCLEYDYAEGRHYKCVKEKSTVHCFQGQVQTTTGYQPYDEVRAKGEQLYHRVEEVQWVGFIPCPTTP